MSSEQVMWRYMSTHVKGNWNRIEAPLTAAGHPDCSYTINGISGTVELKYSNGDAYEIRPSQIGWFKRECRAKGRCFILARFDHRNKYKSYGLFPGSQVSELVADPRPRVWFENAIVVWQTQIDWSEFHRELTK